MIQASERNKLHIVSPATRRGVFNRVGPETLNHRGPLSAKCFWNSSSESRAPSSVSHTDLAFFLGSLIQPFSNIRSVISQASAFQARTPSFSRIDERWIIARAVSSSVSLSEVTTSLLPERSLEVPYG